MVLPRLWDYEVHTPARMYAHARSADVDRYHIGGGVGFCGDGENETENET